MELQVSLEEIKHYMASYDVFFSRSEARDLAARYVWGLVCEGHHNRHSAAGGALAGYHKLETFPRLIGNNVHNAHKILNGVAIAKAVTLAAVYQACHSRPGKSNQAVKRAPHIHHTVEFGVRRADIEAFESVVPVLS